MGREQRKGREWTEKGVLGIPSDIGEEDRWGVGHVPVWRTWNKREVHSVGDRPVGDIP